MSEDNQVIRDSKGRIARGSPTLNSLGRGSGNGQTKWKVKNVGKICEERELCVVSKLLDIADREDNIKIKLDIYKELLPYIAAKNKAVEISLGDETLDRLLLTLNLSNQSQNAAHVENNENDEDGVSNE